MNRKPRLYSTLQFHAEIYQRLRSNNYGNLIHKLNYFIKGKSENPDWILLANKYDNFFKEKH
jgi:hypothetical protein